MMYRSLSHNFFLRNLQQYRCKSLRGFADVAVTYGIKEFIALGPGANVMKLFLSVIYGLS